MNYSNKYLKYKTKYLHNKTIFGGYYFSNKVIQCFFNEIIGLIDKTNKWNTLPISIIDICVETDFDNSFFDSMDRVIQKYREIPIFSPFDKMTLDELIKDFIKSPCVTFAILFPGINCNIRCNICWRSYGSPR